MQETISQAKCVPAGQGVVCKLNQQAKQAVATQQQQAAQAQLGKLIWPTTALVGGFIAHSIAKKHTNKAGWLIVWTVLGGGGAMFALLAGFIKFGPRMPGDI
jgi:fructose-specific phosphotransferase system IIC component